MASPVRVDGGRDQDGGGGLNRRFSRIIGFRRWTKEGLNRRFTRNMRFRRWKKEGLNRSLGGLWDFEDNESTEKSVYSA
jgi:hypothetical protein